MITYKYRKVVKEVKIMKQHLIPYVIGAFIFVGLIVQTFIQLTEYGWPAQSEALLFIALSALIYFGATALYQKGLRTASLILIGAAGVVGLVLVFIGPSLLGGHA